jgi:cytochrome c oxidase subunit 2
LPENIQVETEADMKKLLMFLAILTLFSCVPRFRSFNRNGTAWAPGAFDSNGERIYFTSTSETDTRISYRGGPDIGMMMMGGTLTCASCHGPDAKGGKHLMHMRIMDSPDIRWEALEHEEEEEHAEGEEAGHAEDHRGYDIEDFTRAVVEGKHPDGKPLKDDMPRWNISDEDIVDLVNYLKSLP